MLYSELGMLGLVQSQPLLGVGAAIRFAVPMSVALTLDANRNEQRDSCKHQKHSSACVQWQHKAASWLKLSCWFSSLLQQLVTRQPGCCNVY